MSAQISVGQIAQGYSGYGKGADGLLGHACLPLSLPQGQCQLLRPQQSRSPRNVGGWYCRSQEHSWCQKPCQGAADTRRAYAKEGTCSSEGLTDGRLISDKTGLVEFTGLHPGRLYRLTETAAPDGFQLLADIAYEGGLPEDNEYTVDLTVVNVRTYELPETGSKSLALMPIALILAYGLCGALLLVIKRKKQ